MDKVNSILKKCEGVFLYFIGLLFWFFFLGIKGIKFVKKNLEIRRKYGVFNKKIKFVFERIFYSI